MSCLVAVCCLLFGVAGCALLLFHVVVRCVVSAVVSACGDCCLCFFNVDCCCRVVLMVCSGLLIDACRWLLRFVVGVCLLSLFVAAAGRYGRCLMSAVYSLLLLMIALRCCCCLLLFDGA